MFAPRPSTFLNQGRESLEIDSVTFRKPNSEPSTAINLIEDRCDVTFYLAHPYHSWERGANESTKGLIGQYLPKGCCMNDLSQARCKAIAKKLNNRPQKRYGYRTPEELFENSIDVALHS